MKSLSILLPFALLGLANSSAAYAQDDEGFAYDWNDPEEMDDAARAERDKFETEFGQIVADAKAKREAEKREIEEHNRAVLEYQAAQRQMAALRRKRSEELFKGPDIGAAILRGLGQGLAQGLDRVQREQEARNRAQRQREYENLRSQVAAAKSRSERSRPSRTETSRSGSSSAGSGLRIVDRAPEERARQARLDREQERRAEQDRREHERRVAEKKRETERRDAERQRETDRRAEEDRRRHAEFCASQGKRPKVQSADAAVFVEGFLCQ